MPVLTQNRTKSDSLGPSGSEDSARWSWNRRNKPTFTVSQRGRKIRQVDFHDSLGPSGSEDSASERLQNKPTFTVSKRGRKIRQVDYYRSSEQSDEGDVNDTRRSWGTKSLFDDDEEVRKEQEQRESNVARHERATMPDEEPVHAQPLRRGRATKSIPHVIRPPPRSNRRAKYKAIDPQSAEVKTVEKETQGPAPHSAPLVTTTSPLPLRHGLAFYSAKSQKNPEPAPDGRVYCDRLRWIPAPVKCGNCSACWVPEHHPCYECSSHKRPCPLVPDNQGMSTGKKRSRDNDTDLDDHSHPLPPSKRQNTGQGKSDDSTALAQIATIVNQMYEAQEQVRHELKEIKELMRAQVRLVKTREPHEKMLLLTKLAKNRVNPSDDHNKGARDTGMRQ